MPDPGAWPWGTALGPTHRSQWGHGVRCPLQQHALQSTCYYSAGGDGAASGTGKAGWSPPGVQCCAAWLAVWGSAPPGWCFRKSLSKMGYENRGRRGICCPAHNGNFPAHTLPWQLKTAFLFPPVFWANHLRKPTAPGTAPSVPYCILKALLCIFLWIFIASQTAPLWLYLIFTQWMDLRACNVICRSKACIMHVENGIGGCHRLEVGSEVNRWWGSQGKQLIKKKSSKEKTADFSFYFIPCSTYSLNSNFRLG